MVTVCLGGKSLFVSALLLDSINDSDGVSVLTVELHQRRRIGSERAFRLSENTIGAILEGLRDLVNVSVPSNEVC